ncbi:SEC10/PgrA surface exclusion domain-containing protein [Lactobacillus reuteri]|uniref:SEC10/PgrA surface exclusion domain-containing protein n=1 Tax=Limosilactobacillus reuteri TaxID=1598 RepID=UPI00129B7120|nr:SEC10/PgrA surface exclusion domain-containing protein [Limosilactobacillus reuteri]MRI03819.1 SEC10/PgrA surface exclusion domain-containing protein [Limosilactobacillus reuteri]
MNKNIQKTALTTSAVLAGMVLGANVNQNNVHADTNTDHNAQGVVTRIDQYNKAQQNNAQQLSNLQVANQQKENALREDNAKAEQQDFVKVNDRIKAIQNQVNSQNERDQRTANDQLTAKTNTVRQAEQSQSVAENDAYQSQVATQTKANDQAVANQQQANAQELANAASHIVTPEQKQNQIDSVTRSTQQALDQDKSNHDSTINQLNDQLANDLKQNVQQEQAAKNDLKQPNQADNQKQLADAQNAANKAQNEANNAQNVLSQAKSTLSADQDALKAAQDVQKNQVTNTIKLPDGYVDAWKEYLKIGNGSFLDEQSHPGLYKKMKMLDKEGNNLNSGGYNYNPAYAKIKVTLNPNGTLSREDSIKATQFAVSLLNPIREAIGTTPYKITNASIDVAQDVANGYRKDNWDTWKNSHDYNVLSRNDEQAGNLPIKWGINNIGESWYGSGETDSWQSKSDDGTLTLNDLYEQIYEAICCFLFKDSNQDYGHTTDVLGTRTVSTDSNYGDKLGVNFDYTPGVAVWNVEDVRGPYQISVKTNTGGFHFNTIADASSKNIQRLVNEGYIVDTADPNAKVNQVGYCDEIAIPGQDSQKQIADLQAKVNQAQTKVDQLTKNANTTSQALNEAKAKLADLQKSIADAENSYQQQLAAINTKYSDQATKLKADHDVKLKAENDAYQAKVNQLNSDLQTKLNAIKAQPENTDQLKAQLDQKLAQVKQDGQHKLDQLKQDHEARLQKIHQDAEDTLAAYKANLDQIVKEARGQRQAKADQEIDKLNSDHQALIKAHADQLNSLVAENNAKYIQLKAQLDSELSTLHTRLFPQSVLTTGNGSTKQVFTSRSGKVAYVVPSQKFTTNSVKTGLKQINSTSDSNELLSKESNNDTNRLPRTGNNSSLAMVLLGAAAAMFGVGLVGKKRMY